MAQAHAARTALARIQRTTLPETRSIRRPGTSAGARAARLDQKALESPPVVADQLSAGWTALPKEVAFSPAKPPGAEQSRGRRSFPEVEKRTLALLCHSGITRARRRPERNHALTPSPGNTAFLQSSSIFPANAGKFREIPQFCPGRMKRQARSWEPDRRHGFRRIAPAPGPDFPAIAWTEWPDATRDSEGVPFAPGAAAKPGCPPAAPDVRSRVAKPELDARPTVPKPGGLPRGAPRLTVGQPVCLPQGYPKLWDAWPMALFEQFDG